MQYKFVDGQAIPECEINDHIPYEFCHCQPVAIYTFNGLFVWKHQCKDFADLIDDAESIRMITSIELLKSDQTDNAKRTFIPFPVGCHQVEWPLAANKDQQPDFTDEDEWEEYE